MTAARIAIQDGVEERVSLTRWGGRQTVHLRTWFLGRDDVWRPTRRGLTLPPETLEELASAVGALILVCDPKLREAYFLKRKKGPRCAAGQ